jgi:hypothetical protein
VPVPNPPKVDVANMPMIRNLDSLTQPVYMPPPITPECSRRLPVFAPSSANSGGGPGGVTVFDQGSVGPFNYAVVGSEDPKAMVNWLKENKYQITPPMEPLVDVYIQEKMVFLAMKLQPGKQVRDIQPVKMTYKSVKPMIPLRLTAVAATPNMVVLTWILSKMQAVPENYGIAKVADSDIVFSGFGGSNYSQLAGQRLADFKGRAFITEFAGPTSKVAATDLDLKVLLSHYIYLTRVYTQISPADMTVDPVFKFDGSLPDVSNIHDLSKDPNRIWECNSSQVSNRSSSPAEVTAIRVTDNFNPVVIAIYVAGLCVALAIGFVGVGLVLSRRRA